MLVHNILDKVDAETIDVFTHPGIKLGTLKYKNITPEKGQVLVLNKPIKSKGWKCC